MATVLYITAHPLSESTSYSLSVGKEFINSYRASHPGDDIVHLDLYQIDVPQLDTDVFNGREKLRAGTPFEELTIEEQRKVSRLREIVDQFVAADVYVFVNPMWNFFLPPVLKAYLDAISVAGKTFAYTEQGPIGLLKDKKAYHIQANGGFYTEGPAAEMEMGHRYLRVMMNFIGVSSLEKIFVEGMAFKPDQAEVIKSKAIEQAKAMASVI